MVAILPARLMATQQSSRPLPARAALPGVALRGLHALPLRATQPRGVAVVTKAAAGAFPDPIPGVLPPPKAYLAACAAGKAKAEASVAKTFVMGIAAGAFIGLGCMLAFAITGAIPGIAASNPGIQKLIAGAVFPVGIMMVVLNGADLYTGNTAVVTAAALEGQISTGQLIKNWVVSYLGNFVGSLAVAYAVYCTGMFATNPVPVTAAAVKTSLTLTQVLSRAILANWMVCVGVWQAAAATCLPGKLLGVWFPICGFFAVGLEHSIANMFTVPLGIMLGANVTFAKFVTANLIPVTIGNTIAGVFLVAMLQSFVYGKLGRK